MNETDELRGHLDGDEINRKKKVLALGIGYFYHELI